MVIKEIKRRARKSLKKHYSLFLIILLIGAFIGVERTESLYEFRGTLSMTQDITDKLLDNRIDGFADITIFIFNEYNDSVATTNTQVLSLMPRQVFNIKLDTAAGVLASTINILSSGSVLTRVFDMITSLVGADNVGAFIGILTVAAIISLIFFLIIRVIMVINSRIFLEGRVYDKISLRKVFYLTNTKRWFRVAGAMCTTYLINALWFLTIVGGFIKYYEFYMVPYIIAENPSISGRTARKLSKEMMQGYKLKLLKVDLSLIPIYALSFITGGIFGIFFVNPYKRAIEAECYSYVRAELLAKEPADNQWLSDRYLFEKADSETLLAAYSDLIPLEDEAPGIPSGRRGISAFFANIFGVIAIYSRKEKEFTRRKEWETQYEQTKSVLAGKMYPDRLNQSNPIVKKGAYTYLHQLRRYSVPNLILMFFTFSFIGWCWEVAFHLVSDGVFVNRGTMFGPWLPIYGFGGVGMLILLYKFRSKPILEFVLMLLISGIMEYSTAYVLEYRYGMKWWDYTGYFINIDGRICAEGLLLFALLGICVVYLIAPLLDNLLLKLRLRTVLIIAIVLLALFITDTVYSYNNPNTGKGITEYETVVLSDME